jgi:uncharacterized protein YeaO (DUF488 family)
MNKATIKRIYDAPALQDGYRILVDRLWPRGVRRETARIDLWAKEIAPSTELRKWFCHVPERFEAFSALYTAELERNPAAAEFLAIVRKQLQRGNVTLLYAAKDPDCNHASVLQRWVNKQL